MELWNFRMIIVPPMLNTHSIAADQKLAKPSENGRVPMTAKDISINMTVRPKMEYLKEGAGIHENHFIDSQNNNFQSSGRADKRILPVPKLFTYHHPAISFRDEPPHSRLARYVV